MTWHKGKVFERLASQPASQPAVAECAEGGGGGEQAGLNELLIH